MGTVIDGKAIAATVRQALAVETAKLKEASGLIPGLAVVLVGADPASQIYVRMKKRGCEETGITSFSHELSGDTSETDLLALIAQLNNDPQVHGILVQLPLPGHIDENRVIDAIAPEKDADGFHPYNVGRLSIGTPTFRSCTPWGCMELLNHVGIDISGKQAVVIGRSNIVGKPIAMMLLSASATVTMCHSRTTNLAEQVAAADIVIAAVGVADIIKGSWIKPGAVVIDVGMNRRENGKLCGDVEFDLALDRAAAITPVPGGVGPMTIAMLLKNTVEGAKRIHGLA